MDAEAVEDLFAPLGSVRVGRMFGGLGVRLDGLFFALVAGGEVYLKTNSVTAPAFDDAGAEPFAFMKAGKRVETRYRRLPAEAFDDEAALRRWAGLALDAARAAATRPSRSGSSRRR